MAYLVPWKMEQVLDIATRVSTPIALAGLVVGVVLILFYTILKLNIFPKLNQSMGHNVILSTLKYLYRLAMVSIVLGVIAYLTPIVLGSIFPSQPPVRPSAKINVPTHYSIEQAIRYVARMDNHPSVNFEGCSDSVKLLKVKGGPYEGRTYTDIIKQLQYNLVEPTTIPKYDVRLSPEGYYEITCHR
jgi:hypothetical protein